MQRLYTGTLNDSTDYKIIKNAIADGKLDVILFARDNMYTIVKSPNNRVTEFVRKEMSRLVPGCKEILS